MALRWMGAYPLEIFDAANPRCASVLLGAGRCSLQFLLHPPGLHGLCELRSFTPEGAALAGPREAHMVTPTHAPSP